MGTCGGRCGCGVGKVQARIHVAGLRHRSAHLGLANLSESHDERAHLLEHRRSACSESVRKKNWKCFLFYFRMRFSVDAAKLLRRVLARKNATPTRKSVFEFRWMPSSPAGRVSTSNLYMGALANTRGFHLYGHERFSRYKWKRHGRPSTMMEPDSLISPRRARRARFYRERARSEQFGSRRPERARRLPDTARCDRSPATAERCYMAPATTLRLVGILLDEGLRLDDPETA